ncbi:MAG: DUF2177 family protein [Pseudomonadota bacterium]
MGWIYTYLVTLVAFLAVDAVWLSRVMRPLFEREVGPLLRENIQFAPAIGFYAIYIVGVLYFASLPGLRPGGGYVHTALLGAFLGFLCYGTYEATNMTTLKGWTWVLVIGDTAWGVVLTGFAAVVGLWAARLFVSS